METSGTMQRNNEAILTLSHDRYIFIYVPLKKRTLVLYIAKLWTTEIAVNHNENTVNMKSMTSL